MLIFLATREAMAGSGAIVISSPLRWTSAKRYMIFELVNKDLG